MDWRQTDLEGVIAWATTRAMIGPYSGEQGWPDGCNSSPDAFAFDDGSVAVGCSSWSGPYSQYTPDIDANPPDFWIGTLAETTD